ncbi:MAG: lamin tail domain-containing protein [Verrucomicrobiota bacterium]
MPVPARFSVIPAVLLAVLLTVEAVPGQVVISEFMALNENALEDDRGKASDWIELLNTGAAPVDLAGWSLTDKASDPRAWIFPSVIMAPGGRLLVFASGDNRRDAGAPLHTNFKLSGDGEYLGLVKPDGAAAHAYAPNFPPQITDVSYGLAQGITTMTLSAETADARFQVPANDAQGAAWRAPDFDDSTWTTAAQGLGFETLPGEFAPHLSAAGNLLGTMYGKSSSLFVRIPFRVTEPSVISALRLRMRYDDGFVAWLNGVEVADSLAPDADPLPWNAAATGERTDAQAIAWEDRTVSGQNLNLRSGNNVLAVQLLNRAAGNADALLQTAILAQTQSFDSAGAVYFPLPTPGGVNNAGTRNPGPVILTATDAATAQPASGEPFSLPVRAAVRPSFHSLASVVLKYRLMYQAEATLPMLDDGANGDEAAGDGIFFAVLTTAVPAGQMLRWRVLATDTEGGSATSPAYPDPLDSPQYWGTVAADPALGSSRLPVFQWFVPPGGQPDTDAGSRISVFYLGEFYDNIEARLRGRSTRNFPKKGHNLDFNRDARFRWTDDVDTRRVKDIDLITNWADKSHVRLSTAYEVSRLSGMPSHFAFPVRVQRNAAFHGIFDMIEDGDDRFLERAGLDPEGALYKFKEYNHLRAPVAGYVKKTRETEPHTDLVNLVSAIAESRPLADRRRYAYDFLDIPAMINYHAVCAIIGHRDQGGKNFYIYRDTNGSQQWQFLPWDLDLTLGHTFTYTGTTSWGAGYTGQGYFDDDIDSQQILRTGWDNPIKKILWNVPELNQMFVRRVRTLADQFFGSAESPSPYFPQRISGLLDQLDPPGITGLTDAELDFRKWGFWVDGSGSVIPYTDSRAALHRIRPQAGRITGGNPHPDYPGLAEYTRFYPVDGVPLPVRNLNSLPAWLPGRRDFLNTPGAALSGTLGLPVSQVSPAETLVFGEMEVNSGAAGQAGEFLSLRNTGTQAIDLSGWKLTGAVDYTFPGGCVIPAPAADPVGVLYVAREIAAFRSRGAGPKGAEFRLVVGGYSGQLSARGEIIELRRPDNSTALTRVTPAQPGPLQQWLRVSALLYAPLPAGIDESMAVPQAAAEDFEWIELMNTGTAALDLSGAGFVEGVNFRFPAGTFLATGQRALIVGQLAAFRARYGNGPAVLGEFTGNLNNSGEKLQLVDADGESILDFSYEPAWSAAADHLGHALMVLNPVTTVFSAWDDDGTWAPGIAPGGSPGQEAPAANSFSNWRLRHFSPAELLDAALSGPLGDPDQDGQPNLMEYMAGRSPRQPDGAMLIHPTQQAGQFQFEFPRDPLAVDVLISFEKTGSPAAGFRQPAFPASTQDLPGGIRRAVFPAGAGREFIRLKVSLP